MKIVVMCLMLAAPLQRTVGQYQNIRVSLPSANDPEEVSIAINPTNPLSLAAGANINYYYYSTNGGANWAQGRLTSGPYGVWGDPCVTFDAQGNLYYGHLSNPPSPGYWIDRIVVQKSTNGGVSWNTGVGIGFNPPRKNQDKEWLIADMTNSPHRNNLYVTWTEFDLYGSSNPADSTRILCSRSTDAGLTWSAPVRVSDRAGDCMDEDNTVEGAVPAIGPHGEIFTAWSGPLGIMFDKSVDGGVTWGQDIFVTSQPGGWDLMIPGIYRCNGMPITVCDVSNSSHRGTIYVNWSDQRNGLGNTDVFISKSTDNGATWSLPRQVNDDLTTSQQFFTWMTIDQATGYLYAVFYDRRETVGNATDVYVARSTDGGETFSNFKVSQSPFTPTSSIFVGDYTNIAAYNGKVYPIWMRLDGSTLSVWTALVNDTLFRSTQKLFVRDNGGWLDSLAFGIAPGATDGIDTALGEYELPPLPPTGVFDVRWQIPGTQGTRLDMRDTLGGTRTQVHYRGQIQPASAPGGYPVTLWWNRSELSGESFALRDAPGGTLFLADMRQQDSLVMSNPDISMFQIIHDLRPTLHYSVPPGWNMVSLPLLVDDGRKNWLFPGLTSQAFAYLPTTGYAVRDTLQNGAGYWLRFPAAQDIGMTGALRLLDTVAVVPGWNLIGTPSDSVPVATIQQIPPTIVASQFYGYNSAYSPDTVLLPSRGYWVKTVASGFLVLSSAFSLNKSVLPPSYATKKGATITVSDVLNSKQILFVSTEPLEKRDLDYFELPPRPPAGIFDARFSTNRMLEVVKEGESKTIPLWVSDARYPLTIGWDVKDQSLRASIVVGSKELAMLGTGSTQVADASTSLALKLGGLSLLPKAFALAQNYPNPFNPSTTIKYDLPKDSRVILKLFNILGQEVATLVNEEQKAGYRSIEWNAGHLASGVYFYRLDSGSFTSVKKLVLMK